jgi:pimeloyl-ACP methyl ester carboxylesterase
LADFETHTASSRGYEISFEETGSGVPVALVNGYGGSAAEWREVGYVEPLAAVHRVLSIDSLGHGRSSTPHDWRHFTAPDVALDLVAALDRAEVERVVLWGYSRGAWLASIVAAEYPERVTALVLGGAGSLFDPPELDIEPWLQALLDGDWNAFRDASPELSDYDIEQFGANDPRAIGAAAIGRERSDYAIEPSKITAPVLLYCGGGDDPEGCELVAAGFGVPLHVVGSGDHFGAFLDVEPILSLVLVYLDHMGL